MVSSAPFQLLRRMSHRVWTCLRANYVGLPNADHAESDRPDRGATRTPGSLLEQHAYNYFQCLIRSERLEIASKKGGSGDLADLLVGFE